MFEGILRATLNSGLSGRHRICAAAANILRPMRRFRIGIGDRTIFIDLRDPDARDLLMIGPIFPERAFKNDWAGFERFISKDSLVLDVGANYGVFAAAVSSLLSNRGSITCFEPHPDLSHLLKRMAATSEIPIKVVTEALSNSRGTVRFYKAKGSSNSSLGNWKTVDENEAMTVCECATTTLDAWIQESGASQPGFIKCDVEGAELLVFQGARKALDREDAPVVYFEQNIHTVRGLGIEQFAAAHFLLSLETAGFQLFHAIEGGQLMPFAFGATDHANLFAVPRSQIHRLIE